MESNEPVQSRKLFIGGLDYSATEYSLAQIFEQWGEIVDVVVIKDPITKRSRGFGFVTYSQSSMVDRAMSNRPHNINGRNVETKLAVSREDIHKPKSKVSVKKIFIFGIKEQSENNLFEYFKKFGNIINIKIVTAKDSGDRKGYGFIEYDNINSVNQATLIKSHLVAGGKLDVSKAFSQTDIAGYRIGGYGGNGGSGVNISISRQNSRDRQWPGYHNSYGNNRTRGGYGSVGGGDGYIGSACLYNSNPGRAWPGVHQRLGYNNPAHRNLIGRVWRGSQQPSINLGPYQSYELQHFYYATNNRATPYGNSGASYVRYGYSGNGQYPSRQLHYMP
ncbi:unnamed protein product [Macrosiphum euphorbiae]|uniref:RRM domain-containing protein n=1 Tax=Macrosiphum euphorbiae TaxID=13131 RepID=A0AAV0Y683_9HEMI|nr:unnamed protein product [Macrosiphum euphorbiae]